MYVSVMWEDIWIFKWGFRGHKGIKAFREDIPNERTQVITSFSV